jgi:hypothetical protein
VKVHRLHLNQTVRAMQEDWGFACFEDALRSWIATVAITEVGFEGVAEEWWNELTARDYLADLRRRSGDDWPERWDALIEPWDERFRSATVEEKEPHLPSADYPTGWWQYRSPKRWMNPDATTDTGDQASS